MNTTAASLIGFAGWLVLLTFAVAFFRVYITATTAKAINSYSPDGSDLQGFGRRLTRARDNCFETLPVFVAIVVAAELLGQMQALHILAPWVLVSRIAQSMTHMISTSPPAIVVRALLLTVQLGIYVYWIIALLAGRG
ncbi:MAPEG family protein [Mesorhizobium koreense]|uniref:MAPEG family protein n=1 Tax=Mesorhizobium koreense TaxID=3074855 RepID=UPI00287B7C34|nr:MAPEG family protein [Mesorhizobium sp. WR6]